MNNILHLSLEQIAKISMLLNPIIPKTSAKVLDALNIDINLRNLEFIEKKNFLNKKININELEILFKKIN